MASMELPGTNIETKTNSNIVIKVKNLKHYKQNKRCECEKNKTVEVKWDNNKYKEFRVNKINK